MFQRNERFFSLHVFIFSSAAILAVEGEASALQRTSRYRPDGVTEKLQMLRAKSKSALDGLVLDNLHQFTEKKVSLLENKCWRTSG